MKRIVSVMLALILALTSVGARAEGNETLMTERLLGNETLTTERLLGNILKAIAGVFESPEFSFEYIQDAERLSGGIYEDESGLPVAAGEMTSAGETYGAQVSSEGVVVETPVGVQGMKWEQIAELLLEEMGLDGLMAVAPEDAGIITDVIEDIVGEISVQAFSIMTSDATFNAVPAKKHVITVNIDRLISDVDEGVFRSIMKNSIQMDDLLKRWSPLIKDMLPEIQEDIDSTALANMWKAMGLSQISTGGMMLRLDVFSTGSLLDPWKITVSIADITFEMWLIDGRLQFILDLGMGQSLAFDSRDLEYLWELIVQLPGYITEDAFSYGAWVENGMNRITFHLDGVSLQKQLTTGIIKIIAANREEIDGLLSKYRVWLEWLAPSNADVTADEMIMALTVMNMNARYYGIAASLGLYGYISDNIHLDISYPAGDAASPGDTICVAAEEEDYLVAGNAAEAAACTAGGAELRGWPVTVSLSLDTWSFYLHRDETEIDIDFNDVYGWNWQLTGNYDQASDALNATILRTYNHNSKYTESLNIYADANVIRLYTGDGEVDLRIDILESKAVLSGTAGDDAISGELAWSDGLLKLNLYDGYDIIEAVLRYDEESIGLAINASGVLVSTGITWSENGGSLELSLPGLTFSIGAESSRDSVSFNWNVAYSNANYFNAGMLALTEHALDLSVSKYDSLYGGMLNLDASACWYPENMCLDINVDRGIPSRTRDDFELTYRPGQLSIISGGLLIQVNDVTPEGMTDKNVTHITLYDGYAYINGNTEENTVELNECYTRYELVTDVKDECYHSILSCNGEELCALTLNFDPENPQPVPEDVLWLTPELFRLMYNLVNPQSADEEMPIQVYSEGEAADQAEVAEIIPGVEEAAEQPEIPAELPIDRNSIPEIIIQLQMRLYSLGVLSTDGLEEGILDQKTLQAIVDFQNKVNEHYGAGLVVIDPADPNVVIDTDTLWWLFEKEF